MKSAHLRLALVLSDRIYHGLVCLFPPAFRQTFGSSMAQLFRVCCREALQQQGIKGLLCLWLRTVSDLAVNLALEWSATLYKPLRDGWPYLLSLLLGWLAGYIYLHAPHMQGLVPFLLLCGLGAGLLAYLQPQGAGEWVLLSGAGVALVHLFDTVIDVPLPCHTYLVATLLAVVSALVGASSGVVLQVFIRRPFLHSA